MKFNKFAVVGFVGRYYSRLILFCNVIEIIELIISVCYALLTVALVSYLCLLFCLFVRFYCFFVGCVTFC